jgi:hypothetical protein
MSNHKTLSILLGVSLVLSGHAYAGEDPLRGKPFFDNRDKVVSMPADWVAKDIVHEKALQDADLVITLNQDTYPALQDEVNRYAKANGLKSSCIADLRTSAGKPMNKTIAAARSMSAGRY